MIYIMDKGFTKIIVAFLFATIITGCNNDMGRTSGTGGTASTSSTNSINLQKVLNDAVNSVEAKNEYITGIPLTFQCNGFNNNQPLSLSAGKMSLKADAPDLPTNAIFQIGSSTKAFVAVIALQLEAEGYFGANGLDTTVGEILDNPINSATWNVLWNQIPMRQLLNMTSGIPDYVDYAFLVYSQDPNHYFPNDELLKLVVNKKPEFEHGQGWKYSNTNYVIMHKIISYVTNSSIKELINNRIITKLGLTHTYYADDLPMDSITDASQKPLLMSGYFGGKFGILDPTTDLSLYSLSITNDAGSILSNTEEMVIFIKALFAQKNGLLGPVQLNELTYLVATEDTDKYKAGQHIEVVDKATTTGLGLGYGLGIMKYFVKLPGNGSIEMYAHGGDTLSFDSNWIYSPQKQVYASYVFNSQAPKRQIRANVESKIYEKIANDCVATYSTEYSKSINHSYRP